MQEGNLMIVMTLLFVFNYNIFAHNGLVFIEETVKDVIMF